MDKQQTLIVYGADCRALWTAGIGNESQINRVLYKVKHYRGFDGDEQFETHSEFN